LSNRTSYKNIQISGLSDLRRSNSLLLTLHRSPSQICSCAYCGAADAPWKCGFCHQAMYCDYATCCVKHWREGGGVGGGIIVDAGARHRKVCSRTHAAPDDESEEDEGEEDVVGLG
jgi:hypothetical protein